MSDAVIQRTDADWDELCVLNGRLHGEVVTWRRTALEARGEAAALREQVTALSDQVYRLERQLNGAEA